MITIQNMGLKEFCNVIKHANQQNRMGATRDDQGNHVRPLVKHIYPSINVATGNIFAVKFRGANGMPDVLLTAGKFHQIGWTNHNVSLGTICLAYLNSTFNLSEEILTGPSAAEEICKRLYEARPAPSTVVLPEAPEPSSATHDDFGRPWTREELERGRAM